MNDAAGVSKQDAQMGPDGHQVAIGITRHHSGVALAQEALEPIAAAAGDPIKKAAQPRGTQQRPLDAAERFAALLCSATTSTTSTACRKGSAG